MHTDNDSTSEVSCQAEKRQRFAYGYERWSTAAQNDSGSGARQSRNIERIINKHRLKLVDVLQDRGISAKAGKNLEENFAILKDILKSGEVLIVEDVDRISRMGRPEFITALYPLIKKGVEVIVSGLDDDDDEILINEKTIHDDGVWNKICEGAQTALKENGKKRKRLRMTFRQKRESLAQGKKVRLPQCPFWLNNPPHDYSQGNPDPLEEIDGYILIPEKVALVKQIFKWYLEGWGARTIIRKLERDNVVPVFRQRIIKKPVRTWSTRSIANLLHDRAVMGYVNGVTPPVRLLPQIISDEDFEAVQKIMDDRSHYHQVRDKDGNVIMDANGKPKMKLDGKYAGACNEKRVAIFSHLMQCAYCGENMYYRMSHKENEKYRYYYVGCDKHQRIDACQGGFLRYDRLEFAMRNLLNKAGDMVALIKDASKPNTPPDKRPELEKKLKVCLRNRQRLYDIIKSSETLPKDIQAKLDDTTTEEEDILHRIEIETHRLAKPVDVEAEVKEYQKKWKEGWNIPEIRVRIRELCRHIIEKMVIDVKEKTCQVWIKNASDPIDVKMLEDKCIISGDEVPYVKK